MISLSLFLYLYNIWESSEAQKASDNIVDIIDETEDYSNDGYIEIDGYKYIGTLTISRFGLELPVMDEWSYSGLKIAPGRYSGDVTCNDMVICGHNYSRHFGKLKNLEEGDTIVYTTVNNLVYTYEVIEVTILQPTDVDIMLDQQDIDWDLTLFTCTYGGQARVTVRCKLI